jgi:hypothetical protein
MTFTPRDAAFLATGSRCSGLARHSFIRPAGPEARQRMRAGDAFAQRVHISFRTDPVVIC